MSHYEWSNAMVYKLIDAYKQHPVLRDDTCDEHKDKHKKNEAWAEVASQLDLNKDIVVKKMKTLLFQFQRECKEKLEQGSKWFAFDRMSFLKDKYRHVALLSARPSAPPSAGDSPSYLDSSNFDVNYELKQEMYDTTSDTSYDISLASVSAPRSPPVSAGSVSCRKRAAPDTRTAPVLDRGGSRDAAATDAKDEYSVFGEYVAMKLRKISNAYARCKAQQQIHSVLFNAEFGE